MEREMEREMERKNKPLCRGANRCVDQEELEEEEGDAIEAERNCGYERVRENTRVFREAIRYTDYRGPAGRRIRN